MPLVLRSITSAAASMVCLVQNYTKNYGFEHANPLLIHHILSASIVHLMNTTTTSHTVRRYNTRSVRTCLSLLRELGRYWKLRSKKILDVIEALARRWNVEFVLWDNNLNDSNQNINVGASPENADPFAPISHLMPDSGTNTEDAAFNVPNELFDEPSDLHIGMADYWQPFEWSTEPQLDFSSISFPEAENEALGLSRIFRFGSSDDLSWGFTG